MPTACKGFARLLVATALGLLWWSLPVNAQKAFDHASLARTALERHIRPGYAEFTQAILDLNRSLGDGCLGKTQAWRNSVDRAFDRLIDAWGRIEHIQFGPVTEDQRLERIYFWQDRRGLGAKQLAKVIGERDARVLDITELSRRGVALQGIGALESILYADLHATEVAESRVFRCDYGRTIAANLAGMARAIEAEWSEQGGYARLWLTAGPGNAQFLQPSETTFMLAKSFDNGIERVRDIRIVGPLGFNKQRRATPPELVASGRSMRLIIANIAGVHNLFTVGGLKAAMDDTTLGSPNDEISAITKLVENELRTSVDIAGELLTAAKPFEQPLSQRLISIGFPLKNARAQGGSMLARTANLTKGFNASDGD